MENSLDYRGMTKRLQEIDQHIEFLDGLVATTRKAIKDWETSVGAWELLSVVLMKKQRLELEGQTLVNEINFKLLKFNF